MRTPKTTNGKRTTRTAAPLADRPLQALERLAEARERLKPSILKEFRQRHVELVDEACQRIALVLEVQQAEANLIKRLEDAGIAVTSAMNGPTLLPDGLTALLRVALEGLAKRVTETEKAGK